MSRKGLSMRKVREILRLRIGRELSARQVAASCKVSVGTVIEYEKRAREAGLSWPLPEETDDTALERIVRARQGDFRHNRPLPDTGHLVSEMKRPHVTLHLLWLEYREKQPEGYGYTQFCHYYNETRKKLSLSLRQEHKAGEKLFTDYAGDTLPLIDPKTGEVKPVYIFVAVLGASSYTYAEATLNMALPSWIDSHVRAFEYIGGVPQIVVPDNTRCAVIRPDRYEPDINPTFAEMAAHYGAAIIPARVRKPRDKAKVEAGVLLVERWIMAALRHRSFFSLEEISEAIDTLLVKLNSRKFRRIDATRQSLFERLDRPALLPLPATRYQYAQWRTAKVNIDYHISADKHLYSVPYQLVGEQVDVRLSSATVEILYKNRRVASHLRSYKEGGFTTSPEHRPKSHQRYLEWTPSRIISWAATKGPHTAALIKSILESKPHPEQGYRSCLGIIRLADKYGPQRVEAASERAMRCNTVGYRSVKSILATGLDKIPLQEAPAPTPSAHPNIRGREYYANTEPQGGAKRHVTHQPVGGRS